MILATSDGQNLVLGGPASAARPEPQQPQQPPPMPLTDAEIEAYSRIKCAVCGERVEPEQIAGHSRRCQAPPAPNLMLQLDKWCIASSGMTTTEQRQFVHMRRTEELARVEQLEQQLEGAERRLWWLGGRFGYVISSNWLRQWRSFVGVGRPSAETRGRPPGPIHNGDMFALDGALRPGLLEGLQEDYQVLEQPVWELYHQLYGGGPAILRYNASGVLPALSDQQACFEGDWKELRPDTGTGCFFDPYSGLGFDGELRGGFLWSGFGRGLLQTGSHYEGQLEQGLPHGPGREVLPDGTVFEGSFVEGCLSGFGRVTDSHGRLREGQWLDGDLLGI